MNRLLKILASLIGVLVLIVLVRSLLSNDDQEVRAQLVAAPRPATGFTRVEGPLPLNFPADHGPHPGYQTEWWYYTGNLETENGRHFGYQLTLFRSALLPAPERQERTSDWATDQVYMAHFALTDVAAGEFRAFERFSRGAAGLAGAQAAPFRVWLEDWNVEELASGNYHLRAAQDDVAVDLRLSDLKGPILQGDRGYSQKGPQPGNASTYYSLTRLVSNGTVRVGETDYEVNGLSWMDHEYSTSALGPDLVGWDWFSIQLDDGSELMVYQFRRQDGTIDAYSSGTYIDPDGKTTQLSREDFSLDPKATWRSPHSGTDYPARWTITVPEADLTLEIVPYLSDQELDKSFTYWEGAVSVTGKRAGQPVKGDGYVELTGYAHSMQGQL